MQADLQEAIDFHTAIVAEGGKALVGYEKGEGARQRGAHVGDSDNL